MPFKLLPLSRFFHHRGRHPPADLQSFARMDAEGYRLDLADLLEIPQLAGAQIDIVEKLQFQVPDS